MFLTTWNSTPVLRSAFISVGVALVSVCWVHAAGDKSAVPPIAKIKESIICCPEEEITLDGWASLAPGGEVKEWIWDLDGDGKPDTTSDFGELRISAPAKPCLHPMLLWVKDDRGRISHPAQATLNVLDARPRVALGSDTTVKVGMRILFSPVVVTNCSKPVEFEWDFNDDGTPEFRSGSSGNTSRVYNKPGKFVARFRVRDSMGNEAGGIRIFYVKLDRRG